MCANIYVTIKYFISKFTANQVISSYAILSNFLENIGFLVLGSSDIFGVTGSVGKVSLRFR